MNKNAKSGLSVILSALLAAGSAGAWAVQADPAAQPDAGQLMGTVKPQGEGLPREAVPAIEVQQESRPAMQQANGFKVKVSAFKITGETIFPEVQLQDLIADRIGKEMSLADLQTAADQISRFYRLNGYFVARAYIPAQEIAGGTVEIAVLEGRIGDVGVKLSGDGRIDEAVVKKTVSGSAATGDVIKESRIERGLLLASDLPGVEVKSTLVPGASVGTSDLVVEANQTGTFGGSADLDNFGNKYTGAWRAGGTVYMNNPLRQGDQITLRGMTSGSGLDYARLGYQIPVGASGTKLGMAYSHMDYKLGKDFAALQAKGTADQSDIYALYPFIRGRNLNLYGQLGYSYKDLLNEANAGTTQSRKKLDVVTAGATGDSRDGVLGGGINNFGLTLTGGDLGLDWAAEKSDYDNGIRTAGSYNKLSYNLSRLQRVSDRISLYLAISGQNASKNLDSSEKFVLGGPSGVRAYPVGEASGDEGYLINAEVRWDMPDPTSLGQIQLVGFIDTGHITLNKNPWPNWQGTNLNLQNSYSLSGAGIGVNLTKAGDYAVRASLATKMGGNPGRGANNMDVDNTNDSSRIWLQAVKWF